jgi:hypothetical protein
MEFDIEAAIKLVANIGLRKAAKQLGINHSTLACRIKAHKKKLAKLADQPKPAAEQPAPKSAPQLTRREAEKLCSEIGDINAAAQLNMTRGQLYDFIMGIPRND